MYSISRGNSCENREGETEFRSCQYPVTGEWRIFGRNPMPVAGYRARRGWTKLIVTSKSRNKIKPTVETVTNTTPRAIAIIPRYITAMR